MTNIGSLELFLAILVAAFGGAHAAYKAKRVDTIGLTDIAIWFTAVFFGVGPWVAVISGGILPQQESGVVFQAYLSIGLFIAGIVLAGHLIGLFVKRRHPDEPGEERRGLAPVMAQVAHVNAPILLALYCVAIVIKIYVGYKYRLFFSGDQESKLLPIPYALRSALDLSIVIMDAAYLWGAVMLCARGRYRHIAAVVVVIGILLSFTVGRRWLIADIFLLSLCYYMYRGISLRVFVVSIFLAAILLYVAMPFFWRVRYYRQQDSMNTDAVGSVVSAGFRAATDWDNEQLREAYSKNLASRPVFIRFNMAIAAAQESHSPMMGRVTKNVLLWCVPFAFYESKRLLTEPEQDIQEFYGMPISDTSSNWPAYGLADFGLPGAFLAGLTLGLMIATSEVIAIWLGWRLPMLAICIIAILFSAATAVEETPMYLIRSLRDAVLLSIPFILALPILRRPRTPSATDHEQPWHGYTAESEPAT